MTGSYQLCCVRYIEHSAQCIGEWIVEVDELGRSSHRDSYLQAINDTRMLIQAIYDGKPCPWHDGVPESYLQVMHAMEPHV